MKHLLRTTNQCQCNKLVRITKPVHQKTLGHQKVVSRSTPKHIQIRQLLRIRRSLLSTCHNNHKTPIIWIISMEHNLKFNSSTMLRTPTMHLLDLLWCTVKLECLHIISNQLVRISIWIMHLKQFHKHTSSHKYRKVRLDQVTTMHIKAQRTSLNHLFIRLLVLERQMSSLTDHSILMDKWMMLITIETRNTNKDTRSSNWTTQ